MRLLRCSPSTGASVAEYGEVESRALLADVVSAFADDLAVEHGALARVAALDASHGTSLCARLRAYFESCGSPDRAAAALRVHRNTVRNRLQAASGIGRFDLDDPADRLALALQLHVLRPLVAPTWARAEPGRLGEARTGQPWAPDGG